MAVSPAVNTGTGASISFESSAFLQITNIDVSGITRPSIDTTHMTSTPGNGTSTIGGRTFMPGDLADPGTIEVEFHYNPDTTPPIMAVASTLRLTITGATTSAYWECSGFATDF